MSKTSGIELGRLLKTWALNARGSLFLLLTGGQRAFHEGQYRNGVWRDWTRSHACRPAHYHEPTTEAEVCRIVASATKVRVVGGGHSFNDAMLTSQTLISLDRYSKVVLREHSSKAGWKIATVQAGVRLRDLTHHLWENGASTSIGGSTDTQSIGGIVATDVHGTGYTRGFFSESVLSLRIVDAQGNAKTWHRGEDVFHAALGGAGTCGVVIEAELECEPAYKLAKAVKMVEREWAEDNIEALLKENTHLSFYYFAGFARTSQQESVPGLNLVRMNKWNRTVDPPDQLRRLHKLINELADMKFSGFAFDVARLVHKSDLLARIAFRIYQFITNSKEFVHPSYEGFPRKLFYRHDELEYGVPFENYRQCLREIRERLIQLEYPLIVEVRFTPNQSLAFLGPGTGRRTAYLEITPSMSRTTDEMFADIERILVRHAGRPHLGKKVFVTRQEFEQMYPADLWKRFQTARQSQDPAGKFLNPFTGRLLG